MLGNKFVQKAVGVAVLATMFLTGAATALASSHREAPMVAGDPKVDATDLYAFVSPDNANMVTLIANYIPFEEPAGGPNFNSFDDNVLNRYQFSKSNLKVIEAGIHKVPVIASNIPTYNFDPEFVDGKNILFVNPERQEKDWYSKMKKLILNPNMIEDLGEAAFEIIKRKYSQDVLAERRAQFYKDIVEKHNKL